MRSSVSRFSLATATVDRHGRLDFGMQLQRHLMQADALDRRLEVDLVARDRVAAGGDDLGDVTGCHRAVELTGLAGLPDDHERLAVERLGDSRRVRLALLVAGFEVHALRFELLGIGLGRAKRLTARQEEVAGEAVLHPHALAHMAELGDAFQQNDVHDRSPSG